MQYEDRVSISTPEGVEMELALAGIGSRLGARLIDTLIQGALIVVALIVVGASFDDSSVSEAVVAVIGIVASFLIFWGYDTFFEAFGSGRTPGKRALGLRVVGDGGEPETFVMAAVRNLLRIVDELLTLSAAALIAMVASSRNQRLGDMAAGTLVIKDRPDEIGVRAASASMGSLDHLDHARSWDTGDLTPSEVAAVRRFLERRDAIDGPARNNLARDLAGRLRPKVAGSERIRGNEEFLELLIASRTGPAAQR